MLHNLIWLILAGFAFLLLAAGEPASPTSLGYFLLLNYSLFKLVNPLFRR